MNYPYYMPQVQQYQNLQPTPMSATPIPATTDERIWVQNETGAESYLVAANGFVRLWDSNKPYFYEKRADASGRPFPIVTYKYEKVEPRAEMRIEYEDKIKSLEARIKALEERKNYEQKIVFCDPVKLGSGF